jgi:hypothetical protein
MVGVAVGQDHLLKPVWTYANFLDVAEELIGVTGNASVDQRQPVFVHQ